MSASEKEPHRPKRPGAAAKPFSIRLTDEERRQLVEQAGHKPLATYLRDLVLSRVSQAPRQRQRGRVKDDESLARVLAALGQSRIASNLNQIAKAVNVGILPVTQETEQDISEACTVVIAMRHELMAALGADMGGDRP